MKECDEKNFFDKKKKMLKNENDTLYDFDDFYYREKLGKFENNIARNDKLYEYTFYNIYQNLKEEMKRATERIKAEGKFERYIFELQTEEAKVFNEIVYFNQNYIFNEVVTLIKRILKENDIQFYEWTSGDDRHHNRFCRIENGKKVLYIFGWSLYVQNFDEYINALKHFDLIKIVALAESGSEKSLNEHLRYSEKKYEEKKGVKLMDKLARGTLKAFFKQFFNDSDYIDFMNELNKFNKRLNDTIGYTTITLPNDEQRLVEFKNKCKSELIQYNYEKALKDNNIDKEQSNLIINNYINKNYLYILGNNDFSESFLSSEWYFKQNIVTNSIEKTAIIVGYLKSIEQLLYQINLLSIDKGLKIHSIHNEDKAKKIKNLINFSSENINSGIADITFKSLTNCLEFNKKAWKVKTNVKEFVIDELNCYRKIYRNDLFHKDNIGNIETINEIRNKTLELYCLLLGSIDLNNNHFSVFNELLNKSNHDEKNIEINFKEWINRLMSGNNLIAQDIDLLFWLHNKEIELYEYNNNDNKNNFDVERIKNISIIDTFRFEFDGFYSVIMSIEKWISDYSHNGEFKDIFNKHRKLFLYSKEGFKEINKYNCIGRINTAYQ